MASSPYQDCSFIADFACLLQTTISTSTLRQPVLPHDVVQQLDHHLMLDPLTTVVRDGMDPKRLDAIGTSLWNTCTQMLAVRDKPDDIQALAKGRYVAFVILNLAVPPTMFGSLRSLGASLTAAQTCIVAKQLDAAYKILGVSGDRLLAVQPSHLGLDLTLNYTLTTKYWLLRIRLAVECQQWELAELLWDKVPSPFLMGDCEFVLESTFLAGESALVTNPPVAIKWLQKSHQTLHNLYEATGHSFLGFKDWDLTIRHSLAVASLPLMTTDSEQILCTELANMQQMYPTHPAVMLLELIARRTLPSIKDLVSTFKTVVAQTPMTNVNMELIFQFVHFMNQRSQSCVLEALEALLGVELPREWTEKCFLAYVMQMTRCSSVSVLHIQPANLVMHKLEDRGFPSFGPKTARAAVACLWKLASLAIAKGDRRSAVEWLRICSDRKIYSDCDKETQYEISKKLLACYVEFGNLDSARELIDQGLLVSNVDCKKMYFEYKLAMLQGYDLSNFFRLGFLNKPVLHKQTALLACAVEAQRQKKHAEAMSCAIQLMACTQSNEIYHPGFSAAEFHMFLISLVLNEISSLRPVQFFHFVEKVLRNALDFAKAPGPFGEGSSSVTIPQLQWFYQASYRVGLKTLQFGPHEVTLQALKYSFEFTIMFRRAAGIEGRNKAPRAHFFLINYVRILAYALAARAATDEDEKASHYVKLRRSFKSLAGLFGWEDGTEDFHKELEQNETKQFDIGRFLNFEATCELGLWDEVVELCEDNLRFPTSRFFTRMIHVLFRRGTHSQAHIKLLKRVIFDIIPLIECRSADCIKWLLKLPRYLYCLFLICTTIVPASIKPEVKEHMLDFALANKVLGHIYEMAEREARKPDDLNDDPSMEAVRWGKRFYIVGGKNPFPVRELEHVAIIAFDTAMKLYSGPEDKDNIHWANKAIEIAQIIPGREELVKKFQEQLKEKLSNSVEA